MSYNIIPKNSFQFDIHFCLKDINNKLDVIQYDPYVSHYLYDFLFETYKQVDIIQTNNPTLYDTIIKIINPYEFLYTNIPSFEVSVSKVKTEDPMLFDLIEITQMCGLNDFFSMPDSLSIGHFTLDNISSEYFINMIREEQTDIQNHYSIYNIFELYKIITQLNTNTNTYNCLFMEIDKELFHSNLYLFYLLLYVLLIMKQQAKGGTSIIKISYLFDKSIIDIIYILTCIFDKVQLVKPLVNNVVYPELYLVCKDKLVEPLTNSDTINNNEYSYLNELEKNIHLLFLILTNDNIENICIQSIIQLNDTTECLPYLFINKIEELNSIYGQQHLEILDQVINIYKNKSRDEKMDFIKKSHIQKCIQWCEKNQLPHNKFFEKNIFLCNSTEQ
uniref:Ribosomal RNA methyltransferase FtsJ domain-containing protein n=1 Tax=viral metagenome TaxID=1070528 RepID=A0A6C0IS26_9ZZZZ